MLFWNNWWSLKLTILGIADTLPVEVSGVTDQETQGAFVRPEQSLPSTDLETLNLFADLEPVKPICSKKAGNDSIKCEGKTRNEDFLDPLSSLLIDQDKSDDLPEFLRK